MNTITMSATHAKNVFAELINTASKEPVTITRNNRPVAVVLAPDEYYRLSAISDSYWSKQAANAVKDGFIGEAESSAFLDGILNDKS